MQKLSGTSLGKNNKRCRIFHNESNKTKFAFFWYFYDFLRILQDSAKALYYFRLAFTGRPLKSLRSLQIYPYFTAEPLERLKSLQLGPWGVDRRRPCRIPARWRPGLVGRGWGRPRGSPRARFCWLEGGGAARWAASAAPVGTGLRTASAGVCSVVAREWAAWAAPGGLVEVEEGCLGSRSAWTRSSPRLPPMAPAGGSGAGGEDRRRADGRRLDARNTG
jgi:hypothetical protein